MKKIIAFLMAVLMLLSFAGCGVNKEMIAELKPIYDEIDYAYNMTKSFAEDIRTMEELVEEKGENITFDDFDGKFALDEEDLISGIGLTYYDIMIALDGTEDEADEMCEYAMENPDFSVEYLAQNDLLSFFNNILVNAYNFYMFVENDSIMFEDYLDDIKDSYDALSEKYGDDEIYIKLGEWLDNTIDFYEFLDEEEFDSKEYDAFKSKYDECYAVFGEYFAE